MKKDQKNNPFLNPELQNLQNSLNQIKRAYSGYSQIILPPDSLYASAAGRNSKTL